MLYCEHSTCNHGYMLICCYIKFVYLRIFQEAIKEKQEGDWSVWLSWTNLFNSTVESTIVLNIRVLYTLETVALKRLCWGYFCYKMDWFEVDTRQFETCSTPGSRNVFIFILNILVRIVCDFDCLVILWLGGRKGIRPVKTEWWGAGVVICLKRGADLHMAQLMPLSLTVSCFSKIQIGFTFLVPAHLGSPGKRAVKRMCVCVWLSCGLLAWNMHTW